MRRTLRFVVSAGAGLLLLLAGGLAVFTAETVADEIGYSSLIRRFVREGWSTMVEAGYVEWILWAALLFAGASAALWTDYFIRPQNPFKGTKFKIDKIATGKTFRNQHIHIDGVRHEKCTFHNVTFIYNGGKFEIISNDFHGSLNITSDVREITNYTELLGEFGMLSVQTVTDSGVREYGGVNFIPADHLHQKTEGAVKEKPTETRPD